MSRVLNELQIMRAYIKVLRYVIASTFMLFLLRKL